MGWSRPISRRDFCRVLGVGLGGLFLPGCLLPGKRRDAFGAGLEPLKITACADVHINIRADDRGCDPNYVMDPNERFDLVVAGAKRWNAHVLLNLGDFVQRFQDEAELRALSPWNSFPNHRIGVYGNHDGERQPKEVFLEKMGMPAPYYYKDLPGGWRIIVLDSGTPVGMPDAAQLRWFEQAMESTPGKCVIAIHGALWRPVDMAFRSRIAAANQAAGYTKVAAFLFGHTHHTSHVIADGGTHYIEVNSTNYRWADGGPRYYMSVPYANISLHGDGRVGVQGFGEPNHWAMPDHCDTDWRPRDEMTHQVGYGGPGLQLP